jgi:hypothetical protein
LRQGWRRGQKSQFQHGGRRFGLVTKVSFSSLEMSVVKKSISAWLDWAKENFFFLKIGHDFENWVGF